MKEAGRRNLILLVFKILMIAACVVCVVLLVSYNRHDEVRAVETSYVSYIDEWEVIDSAGNKTVEKAGFRDDRIYDEDFIIRAKLPDRIPDGSFICFITRCETKIYIGGELRKEFDRFKDVPIRGGAVKNFYILIPVNEEDSGKEIEIFRGRVDRRPEVVPEVFIAGRGGIYEVLVKKYGAPFIISVMLLFVSLLVIIVGIGMRASFRHSISMLYAALGVFIISIWLITNSYLYPFAFGHYHIDGLLNYLACMIMPIPFLLYIDSIQKGRYGRVFNIAATISFISLILWTTLHFAGIYSFTRSLLYIDIVLFIDIVTAFVLVVIDIVKGNAGQYKFTTIGFMGFFFFAVVEIVLILFLPSNDEGIPLLLGLVFMLAFVLVQQVKDLAGITAERERAVRLSNAKTAFLASMSHEIRTPINSILGMNEMILRENHDARIQEYARDISSSGKMLLSIINDVLDFSQIEAGRMKVVSDPVAMQSVLVDVTNICTERAGNKGLEYKTVLDGEIPSVICTDEIRLKQVLINLINNAVKYTDEGHVELDVGGIYISDDMYELRLSVKDTGRGIKDEDKAHLFDAFARADMTRNRNIEGTGLGLAIVKRILDSMNGSISVESAYGKGSTFDVLVPVKVLDKTPVPKDFRTSVTLPPREEEECGYSAPNARVLAVDDNESNLNIVRMFLGRVDIKPTLCRGGREAIEMCCDHEYDLILMDHMMPEVDGIEALKQIRNDRDSINKNTPALVLTANAVSGSDKIYYDAGFAGYITKPIDINLLLNEVREFLPEDKIMEENTTKTLTDRLQKIEGMNVEEALYNCAGDEEILSVVAADIVAEGTERAGRMRDFIKAKDYDAFRIEAHSVKGLMATIGMTELSEHAKKHEFAVKDGNTAYVDDDGEALIAEYEKLCSGLDLALKA